MSIIFKQGCVFSRYISLLWALMLMAGTELHSQDSSFRIKDSLSSVNNISASSVDSIKPAVISNIDSGRDFRLSSPFIDNLKLPVARASRVRTAKHQEPVFYLLILLLLIFGVTKNYFNRYFSNMFRVFFNTSLRQNQLAEQLLQSRIPSLLFNLLYFCSAGFFIFILLRNSEMLPENGMSSLFWIIASLFILYFLKYCWLHFLGWLSGTRNAFSGYTFIIFLSVKIMGVVLLCLLPVILLAESWLSEPVTWLTLALMICLLLIRYFKAFNVLSDKIHMTGFHFMVFLLTLELLPLAILWHAAEKYIFKMS